MIERIKLAFNLLRSKSYVLLTDTRAVVMIPLVDLKKFDNILLLSSQTAALEEFKDRLLNLIKEHEEEIERLSKVK